jgi:hypothetical protein
MQHSAGVLYTKGLLLTNKMDILPTDRPQASKMPQVTACHGSVGTTGKMQVKYRIATKEL